MARSRSSFELKGAIASASSLTGEVEDRPRLFDGVTLVSFRAPPPQLPPASPEPPPPEARARQGTPVPTSEPPESLDHPDGRFATVDPRRAPPKLPDLTGVVSPVVRCERILEWVGEATGATDVFLADAAGLPVAGAVGAEVEARLASSGLVAANVASLAASLPGSGAPLFELTLGEGPFFQLIGFVTQGSGYLVGLFRGSPLSVRQAHAVRLACRHALGEAIGNGSMVPGPHGVT